MNRFGTRRLLGTITVVALLGVVGAEGVPARGAAPRAPGLAVVAARSAITLTHWPGFPLWLDLGVQAVAGREGLEVRLRRRAYDAPISGVLMGSGPAGRGSEPLPQDIIKGFSGFRGFSHLTLTGPSGVAVDRDEDFCPNGTSVRTQPDAVGRSPYPFGCSKNPFTLSAVWGLPAGWATPVTDAFQNPPVSLPDGTYHAVVTVNEPYRDLLGVPEGRASVQLEVTIATVDFVAAAPSRAAKMSTTAAAGAAAERAARAVGPKPDLRALPAWDVALQNGTDGRERLAFASTIWTAGTSPLVVEGFRRPDQDVMDAYQYFYDAGATRWRTPPSERSNGTNGTATGIGIWKTWRAIAC